MRQSDATGLPACVKLIRAEEADERRSARHYGEHACDDGKNKRMINSGCGKPYECCRALRCRSAYESVDHGSDSGHALVNIGERTLSADPHGKPPQEPRKNRPCGKEIPGKEKRHGEHYDSAGH